MSEKLTKESIWERKRALELARMKKVQEVMQEYDNIYYRPNNRALIRECFLQGHRDGKFHYNGLGWTWLYCNQCGGRYNVEGPNGEKGKDDGDWDEQEN